MENILLLITVLISQTQQEEYLFKLTDLISLVIFLTSGLLFIGISIPLLYEKIGPNSWYGFRTLKTLSDRTIWYKANKYMAKGFIILGVLQIIFNILLFISADNPYLFALPGNLLFLSVGVGIVILTSFLYLKKL